MAQQGSFESTNCLDTTTIDNLRRGRHRGQSATTATRQSSRERYGSSDLEVIRAFAISVHRQLRWEGAAVNLFHLGHNRWGLIPVSPDARGLCNVVERISEPTTGLIQQRYVVVGDRFSLQGSFLPPTHRDRDPLRHPFTFHYVRFNPAQEQVVFVNGPLIRGTLKRDDTLAQSTPGSRITTLTVPFDQLSRLKASTEVLPF